MVDWYRHRVADCERTAQWPSALWYLDRCLAAEPTNGELYAIRARVFGRLGRPEDHLADLTRAAELGAEGETLIALADEHAALGAGPRRRRCIRKRGGAARSPSRPGSEAPWSTWNWGTGPAIVRCAVP